MENTEPKTKKEIYQTAIWNKTGEYVKLEKYHKYGDYYSIRTIAGERFNAQTAELDHFVL